MQSVLTRFGVLTLLLVAHLTTNVFAQMAGDGAKSKGAQPGAPAGSYTLTDFEHINLYNGNLNFSLPLVMIGGRGGAKSSVNLTIDSMPWQMDQEMLARENLNITWGSQYQHYMTSETGSIRACWTEIEWENGWPEAVTVCENVPLDFSTTSLNLSYFSEYVGPTGGEGVLTDVFTLECGRKPGYGPGVLQGQKARLGLIPAMTLTRLTFIAPDGTEYELRDTDTGGKPITHNSTTGGPRGTTFKSAGGEGIIFEADTPIFDGMPEYRSRCSTMFYPAGYLFLSDGTRYRVNSSGDIEWMGDANGNRISYLYDSSHRVTQITDSLNRQVIVTYDNPASNNETYDDIKYLSDEDTWRHVKVYRTSLSNTLRSGFTTSSLSSLFNLPGLSSNAPYNPTGIATRVELPDENRSYHLRYNSYGVLARVEVPTGGAIEYDRANPDPWGITANEPLEQRRVYAEGGSSSQGTSPDQKQVYSWTKALDSSQRRIVSTTVENYARTPAANGVMTEQLQSKEVHGYYGWPDVARRSFYGPWREGLEFKSEIYAPNSTTPLRRTETEWEQPYPISWFTQTQPNQSPEKSPNNNPRVKSVTTSLMDASPSLVSKQVYGYDDSPAFRAFNNVTDVWEYAFGNQTASNQLLRHTQTEYLITDDSPDPTASPSPSPSSSPIEPVEPFDPPSCPMCRFTGSSNGPGVEEYLKQNLIRLPAIVKVFGVVDGQEQLQARTEYSYDETSLTPRSGIVGWTNPLSPARGNLTTTKKWITPTNEAAFISILAEYDVAGNVIKTTDANNKVTTIDFEDCFGSADSNARNCASGQTYALPTSTTNALGHVAYTKYDYYSGSPVTTEDANGLKTNMFYNDPLGRLKQVVSVVGTSLQKQTTFSYNDLAHKTTSTSDLNAFNDNKLKSETFYDGLGRTTETHSYESSGSFITSKQVYDGLGRVIKTYNPYRTTNDPTYGWAETKYDALGRVKEVVTNPDADNAKITTIYSGNTVTVTDQAGKQRKSVADALGRLTSVFEAPNSSDHNYETRYQYDPLDNLTKVTQGPQNGVNDQTRDFAYDGLSRLKSAKNPESGTILYDVYDGNGNLKQKTDARGVVTNYYYDSLNRPTKRNYSDTTPEVNYYYDAQTLPTGNPALARGASIGQLLAVTYGGSTSINGIYYGYDSIGRAIKSAQVTNGQTFPVMEYGYSLSGSMTWQKYPSGREVTTQYDEVGRLASVSGQRVGETTRTYVSLPEYAAHGAITALKLGNGLWERTQFNARLQPIEIKLGTQSNQESVLKLNYTYGASDNNGNVKSQTITVPTIGTATGFTATQNYEYDPLNRLLTAQENNGANWKQTYKYDRFGNRNFNYEGNGTTIPAQAEAEGQTAIYNPQVTLSNNRLIGYVYDDAGNVTVDAQNRTFAYDAENHQIAYNGGAVITNGDSASYYYDGDGKRVLKKIGGSMVSTVFVYNIVGQLVAEYTDSPDPRTSQTNYLTTDTLGSTRVVTGQDQQPKERHDYLPFGEEIGAQGGRTGEQKYNINIIKQRFTGYERDNETDLDFAQARMYSNRLGRFTSADEPFADQDENDPQTWNLYSYSRNNPLRYTDPDGRGILDRLYNFFWYGYAVENDELQRLEQERRNWLTENIYQQDAQGNWHPIDVSHYTTLQVFDKYKEIKFLYERKELTRLTDEQMSQARNLEPLALTPTTSSNVPQKARDVSDKIKQTGKSPQGYKGGRQFTNDGRKGGEVLPKTDAKGNPITYREYDVNPYQRGVNRGAERIVKGSDGSTFYTNNHYKTFTKIE